MKRTFSRKYLGLSIFLMLICTCILSIRVEAIDEPISSVENILAPGGNIINGSEYNFDANTAYTSTIALNSSYFVTAYQYGSVVGVVDGNTITYGPESSFSEGGTQYAIAKLDNNNFIVAYANNTGRGKAVVGTVSGTTITFGSIYIFNDYFDITPCTHGISIAALDNSHVVIGYCDSGNFNYGTAIIGAISGTTISFGSEYVFHSGTIGWNTSAAALGSNKFVLAYRTYNDLYGRAIIGTLSGSTTISYGSAYTFDEGTSFISSISALNNSKISICYDNNITIGIVTGTTLTFGSAYAFEDYMPYDRVYTAALDNHNIVVCYSDNVITMGGVKQGTIQGTIVSFGDEFTFNNSNISDISVTRLNNTYFAISYHDHIVGYPGYASVCNIEGGYWLTNEPVPISATATDLSGSGLKNVSIYYYYSSNNVTFTGPIKFGTDTTPWSGISWNFTFPYGDGYYRFYSLAIDNDTNTETVPVTNDTICGYNNTSPPELSLIAAGSITTNSATITWTTNEYASSIVEYGITTAYGSWSNSSTNTTSHSRSLSSLSSGTTYHYRVTSCDPLGNSNTSSDQTFTTESSGSSSPPPSNTAPNAEAGGPYTGYINQAITFSGSGSTDDSGVTGYKWDWTNDGTYDTDWLTSATTTHTYTSTGNYTVKLQVKDSASLTDTDTATVTITTIPVEKQSPVADANGPYEGLTSAGITFDGSGSSDSDGTIVNYTWDFGDDAIGYGVSPVHQYTTAGTFTVTLTVKDNDSLEDTDTTTATITMDENGNGVDDDIDETIGVDLTPKDIEPISVNDAAYDLIDINDDGIPDYLYNPTTNTKTTIEQQNDKLLLDVDGDGTWDYIYDPAAGGITPYQQETPEQPSAFPIWIPIVIVIVIIGAIAAVVFIRKRPIK